MRFISYFHSLVLSKFVFLRFGFWRKLESGYWVGFSFGIWAKDWMQIEGGERRFVNEALAGWNGCFIVMFCFVFEFWVFELCFSWQWSYQRSSWIYFRFVSFNFSFWYFDLWDLVCLVCWESLVLVKEMGKWVSLVCTLW